MRYKVQCTEKTSQRRFTPCLPKWGRAVNIFLMPTQVQEITPIFLKGHYHFQGSKGSQYLEEGVLKLPPK